MEDAADHLGLFGNNLTVAPERFTTGIELLHDLVAVAKSATCFALLHPATQATMRLHRKIFEEQGVHRAFQANMQLGDFALGQSDNADARELRLLVEQPYCG